MPKFKKGDYVKVVGLPGRATTIEGIDDDAVFIGMRGTVASPAWPNPSFERIVEVELDNGPGVYWWEEESLERIPPADETRKEFLSLIGIETE